LKVVFLQSDAIVPAAWLGGPWLAAESALTAASPVRLNVATLAERQGRAHRDSHHQPLPAFTRPTI